MSRRLDRRFGPDEVTAARLRLARLPEGPELLAGVLAVEPEARP